MRFVRLAAEAVIQNEGDSMEVILLHLIGAIAQKKCSHDFFSSQIQARSQGHHSVVTGDEIPNCTVKGRS